MTVSRKQLQSVNRCPECIESGFSSVRGNGLLCFFVSVLYQFAG